MSRLFSESMASSQYGHKARLKKDTVNISVIAGKKILYIGVIKCICLYLHRYTQSMIKYTCLKQSACNSDIACIKIAAFKYACVQGSYVLK